MALAKKCDRCGKLYEQLTPELVTGTIGQVLDECILDEHARNLLYGLYQTALADVKWGVNNEKAN